MSGRAGGAREDRATSRAVAQSALLEPGEPQALSWEPFPTGLTARVLVAGVGNIFFGDDGFGVEVAQRLLGRPLPAGVDVVDFGTRGFALACALGAVESVILVDAYPHGRAPGNLTVIEPDLGATVDESAGTPEDESAAFDPASVLRLARAMNSLPARLLLVGCQPATLGAVDGQVGLSAPVEAAVRDAVRLVEALAADLIRH